MSQTTKRALEASLKKLLLQKPLNKITINDITEDCGVNRMTFYYHFKDIYDLVDWILVEDASKILEGRQSFETWNEAFLDILQRVQEIPQEQSLWELRSALRLLLWLSFQWILQNWFL